MREHFESVFFFFFLGGGTESQAFRRVEREYKSVACQ